MVDANLAVSDDCTTVFQNVKMNPGNDEEKQKQKLRYATYKIEDRKTVVVDQTGPMNATYADLLGAIPQDEPRFVVIDYPYQTNDNRDTSKILFIFWSPDSTSVQNKMIYASTKDNVKRRFEGIFKEIQACGPSDLEEADIRRGLPN